MVKDKQWEAIQEMFQENFRHPTALTALMWMYSWDWILNISPIKAKIPDELTEAINADRVAPNPLKIKVTPKTALRNGILRPLLLFLRGHGNDPYKEREKKREKAEGGHGQANRVVKEVPHALHAQETGYRKFAVEPAVREVDEGVEAFGHDDHYPGVEADENHDEFTDVCAVDHSVFFLGL